MSSAQRNPQALATSASTNFVKNIGAGTLQFAFWHCMAGPFIQLSRELVEAVR